MGRKRKNHLEFKYYYTLKIERIWDRMVLVGVGKTKTTSVVEFVGSIGKISDGSWVLGSFSIEEISLKAFSRSKGLVKRVDKLRVFYCLEGLLKRRQDKVKVRKALTKLR